jgi:cation channel sperm-associated protein 3
MFMGYFIGVNLFVGVICQNINEASEKEKMMKRKKREEMKQEKRDLFLQRQREDLSHLIAQVSVLNFNDRNLVKILICRQFLKNWLELYDMMS